MHLRRNVPAPMPMSFLYAFLSSDKMNCVEDPQKDLGGIYVGSLDSANDRELLQKNGIRAVLTVASGTGLSYPKDMDMIEHLILPAQDVQSFDISKHFETGIKFIERNRRLTNVLVHCHAGISRSSTIVIAYLMRTKGWKCEQALEEVRKRRQIITPNPGFLRHLFNFQKKFNSKGSNENKTSGVFARQVTKPTEFNALTPSNSEFSHSFTKKYRNSISHDQQLKPLNLKGNNYFDIKKESIGRDQPRVIRNSQSNKKSQFNRNKSHIKSALIVNEGRMINYQLNKERNGEQFTTHTTEQKGILFGKMLNNYKGPRFSGSLGRSIF